MFDFSRPLAEAIGLVREVVPDGDKRAELEAHLQSAQAQITAVEAAGGWFRGGWRPCIGWVCALGLAIHYLAIPALNAYLMATKAGAVASPIASGDLIALALALSGVAGLRTIEKVRGVS